MTCSIPYGLSCPFAAISSNAISHHAQEANPRLLQNLDNKLVDLKMKLDIPPSTQLPDEKYAFGLEELTKLQMVRCGLQSLTTVSSLA